MKKVIFLALLAPLSAFGQVSENFEPGTLVNWVQSTDGHWKADAASSLSGSFSLHHVYDNPDAGTDQIGIPLKNLHPKQDTTRWSFLLKYGYLPSSLNNWTVFLMSDKGPSDMSAEGKTRGYALGVNLTGSDDILRLWKIDGSLIKEVVNTGVNWETDIGSSNTCSIIVKRSPAGTWMIKVNKIATSFSRSSNGSDSQLFSQAWFGIYYRYSSTRDRLLWLDNISIMGCFYEDLVPPSISGFELTGRNSIIINVNEEAADGTFTKENVSVNNNENHPVSITCQGKLTYLMRFEKNFVNKSMNKLKINKLCDLSENCSENIILDFTPVWAETGDVIISEIMADPTPVVSLPEKEYIELTNRTFFKYNLKDWKLIAGSQAINFPQIFLPANSVLILCSMQDTLAIKKYGTATGLSQFPVLTDEGKLICIKDSMGNLIHGVEYSGSWYGDDMRSDGGWSLEMIDTDYPFYYEGNWKVSESKTGGSPGEINSVKRSNADIVFDGLVTVFPSDSTTVHVTFSEPVFSLRPDNVKTGDQYANSISAADPLFREFIVTLKSPVKTGIIYKMVVDNNISDFAGNTIQKFEYDFGLPETATRRDVLFNELLFNPLSDDPDYVELLNNSGKAIDASRLWIVSVNDLSGEKSAPVQVSSEHRCILPGEYFVITTDPAKIIQRYPSASKEHIFKIGSMPSMPDDRGHLILFNREMDLIDEVMYNSKMHFSLLVSAEGISLEKIISSANSEEAGSWHSATESSGWGTPGAPNSVSQEMPENTDEIVFSSSKITPDNNGFEDFLTIGLHLQGNGNVVSVTVFDETGSHVKKLASNLLAGQQASIVWDGTADDGTFVDTGIYIILITLYDDSGKTEKWKKVCTVIR